MSERGTVTILTDDKEGLLQSAYIQEYHEDWIAEGPELGLADVNWFEAEDVIRQAPDVFWIAFADRYCESHNQVFIYVAPQTAVRIGVPSGLHRLLHIDEQPVYRADRISKDALIYYTYQRLLAYITKGA